MENDLELIIAGAGIAGVSAAVYAKRSGLNFKIFESKAVGGQLFYMDKIDNYIGLGLGATGGQLAEQLSGTLADLKVPVEKETITNLSRREGKFLVETMKGQHSAKTVIVASGASFRKLNITNEDKFSGRGVSYCAVCDGFFFKNKDVAVVGGGNTAVDEALYLSNFAKSVTLIHRRNKLRALDYLQKGLQAKSNIKVFYNQTIDKLEGNNKLENLVLKSRQGQKSNLPVQGLFVAIGVLPNNDFCSGALEQDSQGFILTDEKMKSSQDLIWACGDCRKRPLRQLITAASEGAVAAIEAYKSLRESYLSV